MDLFISRLLDSTLTQFTKMSSTCFKTDTMYICDNIRCKPYCSTPGGRSERLGTTDKCWQCSHTKAKIWYNAALEVADHDKYKRNNPMRSLSGFNSPTNTALLLLHEELNDETCVGERRELVVWAEYILRHVEGTTHWY